MSYIDFVNEDRYEEMEELSKSLFGENWNRDCEEDGICCLDGCECKYNGSCESCPVNICYSTP